MNLEYVFDNCKYILLQKYFSLIWRWFIFHTNIFVRNIYHCTFTFAIFCPHAAREFPSRVWYKLRWQLVQITLGCISRSGSNQSYMYNLIRSDILSFTGRRNFDLEPFFSQQTQQTAVLKSAIIVDLRIFRKQFRGFFYKNMRNMEKFYRNIYNIFYHT